MQIPFANCVLTWINTQEAKNISINFNHPPVAVFNKAQFECQIPFANCVLTWINNQEANNISINFNHLPV